ncbi:MAG: Gfo/Idh/MocA family oxidoreductase [Armatimonadetes bacterium]|nr:Gfo/Idh/MocA family oxidoreductase [Armatimonadota bacterium]MDE2206030.1 Gfo/Idh/MocA family oxidoreductase [Armatimonadota bacterium]
MDSLLRIGLVGCGGMGAEHIRIIRTLPDVELVGICDERPERVQRMNGQYGTPFWLDYTRFLEQARPDIVHICSPSGLHALHGICAARRGVHVLCEKPLDISLANADRFVTECERAGVLLGCIFQRRMSAGGRAVRAAITAGKLGRIISCSGSVKWWRSQAYYDKDAWRGTLALDGGALANQGIHTLDQMLWLAGPVEEVEFARLSTEAHKMECEDVALVVMRYASGARGMLEVTTCCRPDLSTRIELYGEYGSAALRDAQVTAFGVAGEDLLASLTDPGERTGGGSEPFDISLAGHRSQIVDFYDAVRNRRPPAVDGHEGRKAVELLTRIYQKGLPGAVLGTPLELPSA